MAGRYGLEIRAATGADAPGIAGLLDAAGHNVAVSTLAARVDALSRQSGAALVAHEWGPPSGVIVLHWFWTLNSDLCTAQISMLLVGLEARRRGIGRTLLKAASQAARLAGCDAMHLLVPDRHPGMSGFCKATGFIETSACYTRPLRKMSSAVER